MPVQGGGLGTPHWGGGTHPVLPAPVPKVGHSREQKRHGAAFREQALMHQRQGGNEVRNTAYGESRPRKRHIQVLPPGPWFLTRPPALEVGPLQRELKDALKWTLI